MTDYDRQARTLDDGSDAGGYIVPPAMLAAYDRMLTPAPRDDTAGEGLPDAVVALREAAASFDKDRSRVATWGSVAEWLNGAAEIEVQRAALLAALPPVAGPEVRPDETPLTRQSCGCLTDKDGQVVVHHDGTRPLAAPAPAPGDEGGGERG